MLLQACKIWGVYIRQEIVKYLSGPFISRENTCTLHNLTTATYIYVNTNKVDQRAIWVQMNIEIAFL